MRARLAVVLLAAVLLAGCRHTDPATTHAAGQAPQRAAKVRAASSGPKLLVLLVVDQLRADYLWRLHDAFLPSSAGRPGGFRYLMDDGANFPSARYGHFPLFTGPGHAAMGTGAYPYKHGVISNTWFDRASGKKRYCVDDASVTVIGPAAGAAKLAPMSPRNEKCSTLGDELKLATGGQAKVVSLALKDRAAVLMGGHVPDGVVWFDGDSGRWISSSAYGTALPAWATAINEKRVPESYRGKQWEPILPAADMKACGAFQTLTGKPFADLDPTLFAAGINRVMKADSPFYYKSFTLTPFANELTFQTAEEAITTAQLGADDTTDLLCVSLSTNDYVGHQFGPNSAEVMDITVQTDRELAGFFAFLAKHVPGGLESCTIALTADHGVDHTPRQLIDLGFPIGQIGDQGVEPTLVAGLTQLYGRADLVSAWVEPYVYLNQAAIAAAKLDPLAVEDAAVRILEQKDGVYGAWSVTRVRRGEVADTDMGRRLARAVYPKVSGDVLVVSEPLWLINDSTQTSSHGSPYAYDTTVPVLLGGSGIKPGTYRQPVDPIDIVASYAQLAGVLPPSGCEGVVLPCLR